MDPPLVTGETNPQTPPQQHAPSNTVTTPMALPPVAIALTVSSTTRSVY